MGPIEEYDPYSNEVFGGVSAGESQSLNFSIGNVFEIKTIKDPTDTTSESQKITLLNLDLSTGYNFAADSVKLSDLRVSYRTKIGNILNFNGSSSYTFYNYENGRRMDEYLASMDKGLFRLTNLNFSISTTLSGDKLKGEERTGKPDRDDEEFGAFKEQDYVRLYEEEENDFSIPWNLSLNYNYNFSKPTNEKGIISSNLGVNLGFQSGNKLENRSSEVITIFREKNFLLRKFLFIEI